MDANPLPGAFIVEAAEYGLKTASTLSSFAPSVKSKDLASNISLSATLLSEIGKEVNKNASCFKENFQNTFEHVPTKCKEQYQRVSKALEKASSYEKGDAVEGTEHTPQKPWKRLLSALDMDKDQFEEFQESFDESWLRVLMLQYIVSLIVLQIRAQKHEPLTLSEYNKLGQLKKGLGKLLKTIREEEIASVVTFSLADLTEPANAAQLVEAAESVARESCSPDDASIASSSATILNSPAQDGAICFTPVKEDSVFTESRATSLDTNLNRMAIPAPHRPPVFISPPRDDDEYEMYRVSIKTHEKEKAQTRFRLFGIPGLVNLGRTKTEVVSSVDRIPSSLAEIKSFIMREKDDEYTVPPTLNDLVNVSPKISTAIYTLINEKSQKRTYMPQQWNTEFLVNWEWWESKRFGRKQKKTEGYIVILRGKTYHPPPPPLWPASPPVNRIIDLTRQPPGRMPSPRRRGGPGPPPPHHRGKIIDLTPERRVNKKKWSDRSLRRVATQIELTQQETEKVINDFLATFSTLYDGISVEERGAAMRGIDMEEIDELCDFDSDDDSDDSSSWGSGSSRSLVDD